MSAGHSAAPAGLRYPVSDQQGSGYQDVRLVSDIRSIMLKRQGLSKRLWLLDNASVQSASVAPSQAFLIQSLTSSLENTEPDQDIINAQGISRLRLLWKHQPLNAGFIVAGIIGIFYLISQGVVAIWSILSPYAHAQAASQPSSTAAVWSSRDTFDWLIAALMAIVLFGALGAALFSRNQRRMTFGMDITKMIVGFIIGFLSGGARRRI